MSNLSATSFTILPSRLVRDSRFVRVARQVSALTHDLAVEAYPAFAVGTGIVTEILG